MDKDLLDISGEDEDYWLLKSTPNKGREMSYLDCSPLQIPSSNRRPPTRPPFSPIGRVSGNNNKEQAGPSVDADTIGKENTTGNKVELPKLSVERQQMKKKKKNAGFNLRKSLAWDRAFSTEEGVLDPTELSKITGNACQIGGDLLPAIQEEFTESMSASKYNSVSPGLRALEENLFTDLPVNSKHREKKKASGIVSKYASPSKPQSTLAQKKVTSAQDLRSGSKRSGCPRPPPSSSLKRPANVHTTTPYNRELFVSKVSTTKSDPTTAHNMKRSIHSPSKATQSQPTQSKNSQRSLAGSFSKNISSTKSKTKSSLASKSSIPKPSLKQARRNVITKTSQISSVSTSQNSVVGKSNVVPTTTSDVALLGLATNFPHGTMGTSQSSCSKVVHTESTVSRLGKPSGLRVPSPSIGYFSQSDSQPSHSGGDKPSQIPRSDVSLASRFSLIPTLKKPVIAAKVRGVNSMLATGNIGRLGSAAGLSAQSITLKPEQEGVKVDFSSPGEVESKMSCSSLSSQKNENVQQPCVIEGDAGKLVLDDVAICTSKKISSSKCEEFGRNRELPPSGCKDIVQDSKMFDDCRDEKRKSVCSVEEICTLPVNHGPILKNSMESPPQGPTGDVNDHSQLKCSNPGEEDSCITNNLKGQPLNECVHSKNEDMSSPCPSGERDALTGYHCTGNVAQQHEVVDSFTACPAILGDFPSRKSGVADLSSSEHQLDDIESVFSPSGTAEAPDSVQSPCNHLAENSVSNSVLCDRDMVCDGHAVLEMTKIIQVSQSTETSCDADSIGPYPDCKDSEPEEPHFSCQSVLEVKEGSHEIDVLTKNERADKDDSPDMQIDYITGSPDVEEKMDEVKLSLPYSAEVRMETDQLETSDGYSRAKDALAAAEEPEDNSELEDMDLVTESDCSDEETDHKLELEEEYLATESDLISDHDELIIKSIRKQECPEIESIHTTLEECGETKTLLRDSVSSSASTFLDPEYLNEDTELSRISEGMSKDDPDSGCLEQNFVGKAKSQADTEKDSGAMVTHQDLSSHEEEEVQAVRKSPDPVASTIREGELGTPIHMNENLSVGDVMQLDKSNVLSDDTLISEISGDHNSDSNSSCTCSSEGKDQMKLLDAKLEKKPDPIIVKPLDAVPFSEEWLAAMEAAGEEILTLKSGRVQHSPTEKSTPELGPWSPVKKKNNQVVGPFDCTKYTNKGVPPTLD